MSRPTVKTAEQVGKRHNASRVIVLWVDDQEAEMGYVSWGKNRKLCTNTKRLADELYDVLFGYFAAGKGIAR